MTNVDTLTGTPPLLRYDELLFSIEDIMDANPDLSLAAAVEVQSYGQDKYRRIATAELLGGITLDDLHNTGPDTITVEIAKITGETPIV